MLAAFAAFDRSRYGRALRQAGTDPLLAELQGVRVVRVRLVAAAAAGALAGLGGGLYAHLLTYVEPGNFNIMLGVHSLAYGLIGGLGTAFGPVLGVLIDIGLLESSRLFAGYRMIVFGGLVAVLLIVRPRGLLDERAVHWISSQLQEALSMLLRLEGLTVRFGGVEALGAVDLSLAPGRASA